MSNEPTLESEDFDIKARGPGRRMGPEIRMALDNPGRWVRCLYDRYTSLGGSLSKRRLYGELWQITRDKEQDACWIRFDGPSAQPRPSTTGVNSPQPERNQP